MPNLGSELNSCLLAALSIRFAAHTNNLINQFERKKLCIFDYLFNNNP